MQTSIKKLRGANMDIDLASQLEISWRQDLCPWNVAEETSSHRCALKNISLCPYFCGVEYPDLLLCSYPGENPLIRRPSL